MPAKEEQLKKPPFALKFLRKKVGPLFFFSTVTLGLIPISDNGWGNGGECTCILHGDKRRARCKKVFKRKRSESALHPCRALKKRGIGIPAKIVKSMTFSPSKVMKLENTV